MTKKIRALKRLEQALAETHLAFHEVPEDLGEQTEAQNTSPPKKKSNNIIPPYVFEAYYERRERGEWLDKRYRTLWLRERELVTAYNDPLQEDKHDSLLAELEAVRQAMTEIEAEDRFP